jgi:hypothetical protein
MKILNEEDLGLRLLTWDHWNWTLHYILNCGTLNARFTEEKLTEEESCMCSVCSLWIITSFLLTSCVLQFWYLTNFVETNCETFKRFLENVQKRPDTQQWKFINVLLDITSLHSILCTFKLQFPSHRTSPDNNNLSDLCIQHSILWNAEKHWCHSTNVQHWPS